MRKYILNIVAVSIAFFTSAFSGNLLPNKYIDPKYYVYDEGAQNAPENYTVQSTQPSSCLGSSKLCWLKVTDIMGNLPGSSPDGDVDDFDFTYWFDHHDDDNDNSLDDEAQISGWVEKKLF